MNSETKYFIAGMVAGASITIGLLIFFSRRSTVNGYKKKLAKALEEEKYEEAAVYRDKIQKLKQ